MDKESGRGVSHRWQLGMIAVAAVFLAALILAADFWIFGGSLDRLVESPQARPASIFSASVRRYEDPRPLQGSVTIDSEGWYLKLCGVESAGTEFPAVFGLSFPNQAAADQFFAAAHRLGLISGSGSGVYVRFTGQVYHYQVRSIEDLDGSGQTGMNIILQELLEMQPA